MQTTVDPATVKTRLDDNDRVCDAGPAGDGIGACRCLDGVSRCVWADDTAVRNIAALVSRDGRCPHSPRAARPHTPCRPGTPAAERDAP